MVVTINGATTYDRAYITGSFDVVFPAVSMSPNNWFSQKSTGGSHGTNMALGDDSHVQRRALSRKGRIGHRQASDVQRTSLRPRLRQERNLRETAQATYLLEGVVHHVSGRS